MRLLMMTALIAGTAALSATPTLARSACVPRAGVSCPALHCDASDQRCGDTYIPRTSICHLPRPRAPHCRPGVTQPCGRVCIALHLACHPDGQAGGPVSPGFDVTPNRRP